MRKLLKYGKHNKYIIAARNTMKIDNNEDIYIRL